MSDDRLASFHRLVSELLGRIDGEADVDDVLRDAVAGARTILAADYLAVFEQATASDELHALASDGWTAADHPLGPLRPAEVGALVIGDELVFLGHGDEHHLAPESAFLDRLGIAAGVLVPLTVDAERRGVVAVYDREARQWDEEEQAIVRGLAEVVGLALAASEGGGLG